MSSFQSRTAVLPFKMCYCNSIEIRKF